MEWQQLTTEPNALGESPFWHPMEQKLYWVDIVGKAICRTDLHTKVVEKWAMPSEPGCIAPMQGGGLVMALRHGIYKAQQWGGCLEHVATLPYNTATVRANDGKCDAQGRFWVGTVDETKQQQSAGLFCLDCTKGDAEIRCLISNATTANGLAWSPDHQTMYWADTPTHTVHAWSYDNQNANLSNQHTFAQFKPKPQGWLSGQTGYQGRPDGATVDVKGNYYVAMYEGGQVAKYAADGSMLAQYPTPMLCPTMPCFGGHDLRTLFVTSARHGRSSNELKAHPLSGCVIYTQMDVPGLPVQFFKPA